MKHHNIIPAIISAAIITLSAAQSAFAEDSLFYGKPLLEYSAEAQRLNYIGEMGVFSVDIPTEPVPEISVSEPQEVGDGSTSWELFYGSNEDIYISCCFHQNEGGYDNEMAVWAESDSVEIIPVTNADFQAASVVDFVIDDLECLIGEYECGEDTWINITFGGNIEYIAPVRDELISMLTSFSRDADTFSNENNAADNSEGNPPETDKASPDTGVEMLPIAVPVFAAAALFLSKKRK
ncbi:MAG: hypothetical protein ACI4XA_05645 [Oscillospiraceae bacterium]